MEKVSNQIERKNMVDIEKLKNSKIYIQGLPKTGERLKLIEEAIKLIQDSPNSALNERYIGFKNYAGFGDQRCDCAYGMGPTHGSIVYSIGRYSHSRNTQDELGENEIYYLLVARDNPFGFGKYKSNGYEYTRDLSNFISHIKNQEEINREIQHNIDTMVLPTL